MGLAYLGKQFEALGSKVRRIYDERHTIPMPDTSITMHSTTMHSTPNGQKITFLDFCVGFIDVTILLLLI